MHDSCNLPKGKPWEVQKTGKGGGSALLHVNIGMGLVLRGACAVVPSLRPKRQEVGPKRKRIPMPIFYPCGLVVSDYRSNLIEDTKVDWTLLLEMKLLQ